MVMFRETYACYIGSYSSVSYASKVSLVINKGLYYMDDFIEFIITSYLHIYNQSFGYFFHSFLCFLVELS